MLVYASCKELQAQFGVDVEGSERTRRLLGSKGDVPSLGTADSLPSNARSLPSSHRISWSPMIEK